MSEFSILLTKMEKLTLCSFNF